MILSAMYSARSEINKQINLKCELKHFNPLLCGYFESLIVDRTFNKAFTIKSYLRFPKASLTDKYLPFKDTRT